jgi:hypothetical protein
LGHALGEFIEFVVHTFPWFVFVLLNSCCRIEASIKRVRVARFRAFARNRESRH